MLQVLKKFKLTLSQAASKKAVSKKHFSTREFSLYLFATKVLQNLKELQITKFDSDTRIELNHFFRGSNQFSNLAFVPVLVPVKA